MLPSPCCTDKRWVAQHVQVNAKLSQIHGTCSLQTFARIFPLTSSQQTNAAVTHNDVLKGFGQKPKCLQGHLQTAYQRNLNLKHHLHMTTYY